MNAYQLAFLPVMAVVVIHAQGDAALRAGHAHHPGRDRVNHGLDPDAVLCDIRLRGFQRARSVPAASERAPVIC